MNADYGISIRKAIRSRQIDSEVRNVSAQFEPCFSNFAHVSVRKAWLIGRIRELVRKPAVVLHTWNDMTGKLMRQDFLSAETNTGHVIGRPFRDFAIDCRELRVELVDMPR